MSPILFTSLLKQSITIRQGSSDFKHNLSIDLIRQCAVEKEWNHEASQNAGPGTIKRMQFTFSVNHLTPPATTAKKPALESKDGEKRDAVNACSAVQRRDDSR
jgi:hypothetical protein